MTKKYPILIIFSLCFCTVYGQPPQEPSIPLFLFSGSSALTFQNANRQGTLQELPRTYTQWDVRPMLTVYDIPVTARAFVTTLNDPARQSMNTFSVAVDLEQLKANLRKRAQAKIAALAEIHSLNNVLTAGKAPDVDALKREFNLPRIQAQTSRLRELEDQQENDTLTPEERDEYTDLWQERETLLAKRDALRKALTLKQRLRALDSLKAAHPDFEQYAGTDFERMKVDITDNDKLAGHLQKFGMISGGERFFNAFEALGVGINYPEYSPFILRGVPVNGAAIEYNPAWLYAAFAGGSVQRAVADTGLLQPTFARSLYAARLGYGQKSGFHIYLTGLYTRDDETSLSNNSETFATPKENYIGGIEVQAPIGALQVQAEAAGSVLTDDIRDPAVFDPDIPNILDGVVNAKTSTAADYAWSAKASYRRAGTRVTAQYQEVGPGYRSLGVPLLRKDYRRIEGAWRQQFWRRQISLQTRYRYEQDNLIGAKRVTTTINAYGVHLAIAMRNLPYLSFGITPYGMQNDDDDSLRLDYKNILISASAAYGYSIGALAASSNFSYSSNENSVHPDSLNLTTQYALSQSVSFAFPLSLTASFTSVRHELPTDLRDIASFALSGSVTVFGVWRSTVRITLSKDEGREEKLGALISSTYPVPALGTFGIRLSRNTYEDRRLAANDYDEFIARLTLETRW